MEARGGRKFQHTASATRTQQNSSEFYLQRDVSFSLAGVFTGRLGRNPQLDFRATVLGPFAGKKKLHISTGCVIIEECLKTQRIPQTLIAWVRWVLGKNVVEQC